LNAICIAVLAVNAIFAVTYGALSIFVVVVTLLWRLGILEVDLCHIITLSFTPPYSGHQVEK
jgi:hypothetical protein